MSRITTILWDVGGTLLDWATPGGSDDSLARCCRDCNIDPALLDPDTVAQARREWELDEPTWRTTDDERAGNHRHAAALLRNTSCSDDDIGRLGHRLAQYFDVQVPIAGIPQLLNELTARGLTQGIVSNWPPSLAELLHHHHLACHFRTIACSAIVGALKPSPQLFQCALDALKTPPQRIIFIGNDPLLDIVPARALGMHAIHFDPRRQHPQRQAATVTELRDLLLPLLNA